MDDFIQTLVCRSAPLPERLRGEFVPADESTNPRDDLWLAWADSISRDDPLALARRLKLSGIDPAAAKRMLGDVVPRAGASIPAWALILEKALACDIPDCSPEGWETFYYPFLATARALLREQAGDAIERLSDTALTDLERALRWRLHAIVAKPLDFEFALRNATTSGGGESPEEARISFARHCVKEKGFFTEYPVAARLIGLAVEFWIEATAEFLQRLDAEQTQLESLFGKGVCSLVESVQASLSDPHRRGRSVLIATFAEGLKLVYKPRSLGQEAGWFEFARWLNERGCPIEWKVVRVLDRGTHGWMEFISHASCNTEEEAALYFERAGAMLGLLYALAGSDMHLENLIAHGAYPVPIDLEVLMMASRGNPDHDEKDAALENATQTMRHSVLNIGLLPSWVSMGKGKIFNLGGFGANEDATGEPGQKLGKHQPLLHGVTVSSHLHRPGILKGFHALYEFLLLHRDAILHPDGPLERFRGEPARFVNRATSIYMRVLRRAITPASLASGVKRSLEFEVLLKSALHAPAAYQDEVLAVTTAEIQALEQGDVPFFQNHVDSPELKIPETGAMLPLFFREDGFSISRNRILNLSPNDLALQTKLIGLSFDLVGDGPTTLEPERKPVAFPAPSFRDEAYALARVICEEAIVSGDDATWIAPQMIANTERFHLQPGGSSLYDGSLGVMLFLLAAEIRLGDKPSGNLARQVFASFRRSLGKAVPRLLLSQQPLGLQGLSGQIYALLTAAKLSGDTAMTETALELGGMITDATLAREKQLDLLSGLAGAIPALLALHAATGDSEWLRKAIVCGDRLLATREVTENGRHSWKCAGKFLAGYSHGAAGCAASLLRLHAVCGDDKFRDAAIEAIEYENSLFVPEVGNWKDLRFEGGFMASWCHGGPGILLGRLLGGERESEDISRALQGTIGGGLAPVDQCCCGNSGKADILLTAAKMLGDNAAADAARELMQQTISQAHANGGYRCYGKLPRTVRGPGFFQGFSGIGYTLLRLEGGLPSVLAME